MEVRPAENPKFKVCMLLSGDGEIMDPILPRIGICSYITNFGHEVSWVISSHQNRQMQEFSIGDVRVYVTPHSHIFPGSSILSRAFNRIPDIVNRVRFTLKIFHDGKYNMILVRDGALDGLIAVYIKWRYSIPFILVLSNPIGTQRHSGEYWSGRKLKSLHYALLLFVDFIRKELLRHADLILTHKWIGDEFTEQFKVPSEKIVPCPSGVDAKTFLERDSMSFNGTQPDQYTKVLVYVGSMEPGRMLSLLVQAFSIVRRKKGGVKLLMVGDGTDRANLENLAHQLGVEEDIVFTGKVPQAEIPDRIATADIGVCPVPPTPFFKVSSPIKMFEYMAIAKPVVANDDIPEQKEVLEESGGGSLVPFTPEAFAEAIIGLLDNPEKAADMGKKGREWVMENRTYERIARSLEERYFELLG